MKYAKASKILAILAFVMAASWLGIFMYFMIDQFNMLFVEGLPSERWIFLTLFLGGFVAGIVFFIKEKKASQKGKFLLIGSFLFMAGSLFSMILGIQINKLFGGEGYYDRWYVYVINYRRYPAIGVLVSGIFCFLLWISHFVLAALSNPRVRALLSGTATQAEQTTESKPEPAMAEKETPVQAEAINIADRVKEAKAMLDEGLIDQEDFKKIKAHILSSDF